MIWQAAAALGVWTGLIGGVLYLVVRLSIRTAIDEAIIRINGTYVRAAGTYVTGRELERRVEALEERHAEG